MYAIISGEFSWLKINATTELDWYVGEDDCLAEAQADFTEHGDWARVADGCFAIRPVTIRCRADDEAGYLVEDLREESPR